MSAPDKIEELALQIAINMEVHASIGTTTRDKATAIQGFIQDTVPALEAAAEARGRERGMREALEDACRHDTGDMTREDMEARRIADRIRARLDTPAPEPAVTGPDWEARAEKAGAERDRWKANCQNATGTIGVIRAMIGEMFGTAANIESQEATLLRGPEPKHDGEAILEALQRVQSALESTRAERDGLLRVVTDNHHAHCQAEAAEARGREKGIREAATLIDRRVKSAEPEMTKIGQILAAGRKPCVRHRILRNSVDVQKSLRDCVLALLDTPEPAVTVQEAISKDAVEALENYAQADMDGTFVSVSRQALDECLPTLRALARKGTP